jgi:hypothetical protein
MCLPDISIHLLDLPVSYINLRKIDHFIWSYRETDCKFEFAGEAEKSNNAFDSVCMANIAQLIEFNRVARLHIFQFRFDYFYLTPI